MTSRLLWAALAFVGGALLSVQSRMNGELATVFGHGLDAALWSFGSGTVALTVALLVFRPMRSGLGSLRGALADRRLRWYQCVGGAMGGLFVLCQSYAVPLAGVALWTVAVVGGQTASGMGVDRLGIGPAGRLPVTAGRGVAAVLAVAGVLVAVGGRVSTTDATVVLPVVLSVLAGVSLAVQSGINGRVGVASGNAFTTAWLNFTLGLTVLVLLIVPEVLLGQFGLPNSLDAPWWAWWGGLLGVAVVAAGVVGVRYLGVLLQLLLMLVGQLSAAALLDLVNPATRSTVTPVVLFGLLVTLGAAALAGISATRARRAERRAEDTDRQRGRIGGRDRTDSRRQGHAGDDQGGAEGPGRGPRARGVVPGLGTVLVGDDPGSTWYVGAKHKDSAEIGITSIRRDLPATATQAEVEAVIDELNADPDCTGFLVQQPTGLDEMALLSRVDPEKDIDGLHPTNLGWLVLGKPAPLPCTPMGCIELLRRFDVPIAGAHVVIVGRGITVGRPLGLILTRKSENATVTICHTGTKDLAAEVRQGDIVVAAAGVPGIITADMVKPGAAVLDVGVSRVGGKPVGDVAADVAEVAGWLSPNPGGVGPLTRAMLLTNVVAAAERHAGLG